MAASHQDLYVVYLRSASEIGRPDGVECPVMACSSYGEARRLQRMLQHADQETVIRFQGDTGGGD